MKKLTFLLAAIFLTAISFAQPDFSGTWILNKEKSELGEQFSMAPKEMIVVQTENSLSYDKHSEWQGQEITITDKFTLDGEECVNKGWMDTQKKSTAVWSDDKKSLKITSKIPIQDETMTIIEVYKMNGKSLVLESSASSSFGDMEEKQVFNKK